MSACQIGPQRRVQDKGQVSAHHHRGDRLRKLAGYNFQLIEAQKSTVKKPAMKGMTTRIGWAKDTQKRMAVRGGGE